MLIAKYLFDPKIIKKKKKKRSLKETLIYISSYSQMMPQALAIPLACLKSFMPTHETIHQIQNITGQSIIT